MILISIDPGLNGGLCRINTVTNTLTVIRMPTRTVIDKPAITIFARDATGKKVLIKSGPHKGTYKSIIKTPAKTHKELDCNTIVDFIIEEVYDEIESYFVIESPAMSIGNSSRSTASTNRNFGKLLAIAELSNIPIIQVPPHVWKGALDLGRDKQVAIDFTQELLTNCSLTANQSTFTSAEDGLAESVAIAYYYNKSIFGETNDTN